MPLVPAICTQCGAQIEVDNTHEAGICKHCGTAFITEKAINNYSTYITNNNNFAGANIAITNEHDAQWYYEQWMYLYTIRGINSNNGRAFNELDVEFTKLYPNDYRRIYTNLINLSNNFAQKIWSSSQDVWDLDEMKEKYTYINIYGLTSDEYSNLVNIREYIYKCSKTDGLARDFLVKLDEHIRDVKKYRRQLISGKHCNNIIKVEPNPNYIPPKEYKNSGCYVATCVYGSYDCPEVWTLRRFRDYTLDSTWYGRLFIKCYYAISPTIVKWFGETRWFKTFWKTYLDKMVYKLNSNGFENTRYQDKY